MVPHRVLLGEQHCREQRKTEADEDRRMVTTNCQDIKEETRNPLGDPWDWRGYQGLPPAPQDPWELVLHDAKDHIRTGAGRVFRHLTCSSGLAFGKKGTMPLASKMPSI